MERIYLALLVGCCLFIIAWASLLKERMLQIPFWSALVFLGWVFPQLVGLYNDSLLALDAYEKATLMSVLCLVSLWAGHQIDSAPLRSFRWALDAKKLLVSSAVLTVIGGYFFFLMSRLVSEAGSNWTGIITIYHFFSGLMTFGFVIAVLLHIRRPTWVTIGIISINLLLYADRIIFAGRRAAMIELAFIVMLAIYFQRRWVVPRVVILLLALGGALFVNSTGQYRSAISLEEPSGIRLTEVLEIDYVGNLMDTFSYGGRELRNAVLGIAYVDGEDGFDFGASMWNNLVDRYVPGQFVGTEVKASLKSNIGNRASEEFQEVEAFGSTSTGIYSAYASFWYLGAAFFLLIGWIMRRWHEGAVRGHFVAQAVLMLMFSPALHSITHSHTHFFVPFVQWAVFLIPIFWLARIGRGRSPRGESRWGK